MSLEAKISLPGMKPSTEKKNEKEGGSSVVAAKTADNVIIARIFLTNGATHKEAYLTQLPKSMLEDGNLSGFRTFIAGSTESKEIPTLPFCTKKGAIVPDYFSIKEYLTSSTETITDSDTASIDIYMKKEGLVEVASQSTPAVPLSQVVDARTLAVLKQSFDENAFKLLTGTAAKSAPRLEEQDWSMVSDNNGLCYGITLIRRKEEGAMVIAGVERARYPAFRFSRRTFFSEAVASSSVKDVEVELRIPEYIVDDQSYVSSYETTTSLQSSMATSSFTETDVSAAASGSVFGCSISGSASYGQSEKDSSVKASKEEKRSVTLAYNFPRVTLVLDEGDLELTPECQRVLTKVKSKEALQNFLSKYGEFFSQKVQLGGRLFCTEEVDSSSKNSANETAKSMKVAASVAFSGWGASASVSASHAQQSTEAKSNAGARSSIALTWQANGGDTLLCNDPKAWSPTVALHDYWRVTKRDCVVHIVDLLGKMRGFDALPSRAAEWNIRVTKPANVKKQKFLLGTFDEGKPRYLAAHTAEQYPLGEAALDNKNLTNDVEGTLGALFSRGALIIKPGTSPFENPEIKFHCETPEGDKVSTVAYNTLYRLVGSDRLLYPDCSKTMLPLLFAAEAKGLRMCFQSATDESKTGEIPSGAKLKMLFFHDGPEKKKHGTVINGGSHKDNTMLLLEKSPKLRDRTAVFKFIPLE